MDLNVVPDNEKFEIVTFDDIIRINCNNCNNNNNNKNYNMMMMMMMSIAKSSSVFMHADSVTCINVNNK